MLAEAGLGSRRQCEELILAGRVQIEESVCQQLGVKVDPVKQKIFVDGQQIKMERKKYFAINKPPGVLSTNWDPTGRVRVIDLIQTNERVYNVGRLDKSSEGLIIVTNDGDLANRLTHPRYRVAKIYQVHVAGVPERADLHRLQKGVYLAEGFAKVENVKIKKRIKGGAELEIVLTEGRNREIRRLLAKIGHKVLKLKRIAIGTLRLGELPAGACRELTRDEVKKLKTGSSRRGKKVSSRKVQAKKKLAARVEESRKKALKRKKPTKKKSGKKSSTPSKRTSKRGAAKLVSRKKKTKRKTTQRAGTKRVASKKKSSQRSKKAANKSRR